MTLARRTAAVSLAAVTAATALIGGTTAPAQAGGCSLTVCGGVTNSASSNATIPTTTAWVGGAGDYTSTASMNYTPVSPGQTRGGNFSGLDVDGFFTSTGCTVTGVSGFLPDDSTRNRFVGGSGTTTGALRSNKWIKISTNEQVTVKIIC